MKKERNKKTVGTTKLNQTAREIMKHSGSKEVEICFILKHEAACDAFYLTSEFKIPQKLINASDFIDVVEHVESILHKFSTNFPAYKELEEENRKLRAGLSNNNNTNKAIE